MEEQKQSKKNEITGLIDKFMQNEESKKETSLDEFMPELKKGGKEKIREINPKSELDNLENQKIEEKKVGRGKTFLIFLKSQEYQKSLLWVLKGISKEYKKIIYFTLNTPKNSLLVKLESENINTSNIFFIDAVSLTNENKSNASEENCVYVSSPDSLVEMSLALSNVIATLEKKGLAVVFDSVSTLLNNDNEQIVSKFVHTIATKAKSNDIDAYFFALREDLEKSAIKEIGLFMDETTTYEESQNLSVVNKHAFVPNLTELISEVEEMHRQIDEKRYERGIKEKIEQIKQRLELLDEINNKIQKLEFRNEKERENNEILSDLIKEIKSKISKVENISSLEEKFLQLYRKVEEHDEKTQLNDELRRSIENQKSNELKNSIEEVKEKLKQLESIGSIRQELKSLEKKVEEAQTQMEKLISNNEAKEFETKEDLERKVNEIAKKIDEVKKSDKVEVNLEPLSTEIDEIKEKIDKYEENYNELIKDYETKNKAMTYLISDVKDKLGKLEKIAEIEKNVYDLGKKFEETQKELTNFLKFPEQITKTQEKINEIIEKEETQKVKLDEYKQNITGIQNSLAKFDILFKEVDEVREKIEETQKELTNFLKFPEQITKTQEKEDKEIETIKQTEQQTQEKIKEMLESINRQKSIETKINEIIENEKRKEEIEKEKLEYNLKMLKKVEELEATLSKLEKRLEISELERMLAESDSELRELNREKSVAKEALKRILDPNYSSEKSAELKATLENIQSAERTIMDKMKEITKRIQDLKEEKNAG